MKISTTLKQQARNSIDTVKLSAQHFGRNSLQRGFVLDLLEAGQHTRFHLFVSNMIAKHVRRNVTTECPYTLGYLPYLLTWNADYFNEPISKH